MTPLLPTSDRFFFYSYSYQNARGAGFGNGGVRCTGGFPMGYISAEEGKKYGDVILLHYQEISESQYQEYKRYVQSRQEPSPPLVKKKHLTLLPTPKVTP